jgi:hypothetical protein
LTCHHDETHVQSGRQARGAGGTLKQPRCGTAHATLIVLQDTAGNVAKYPSCNHLSALPPLHLPVHHLHKRCTAPCACYIGSTPLHVTACMAKPSLWACITKSVMAHTANRTHWTRHAQEIKTPDIDSSTHICAPPARVLARCWPTPHQIPRHCPQLCTRCTDPVAHVLRKQGKQKGPLRHHTHHLCRPGSQTLPVQAGLTNTYCAGRARHTDGRQTQGAWCRMARRHAPMRPAACDRRPCAPN